MPGCRRADGVPPWPGLRGSPDSRRWSTNAPAGILGAGAEEELERRLPGELELGWRSGRSEGRGRGGQAQVFEDRSHDLAVGDECDELSLLAATRGQVRTSISKTHFKSSAREALVLAARCGARSGGRAARRPAHPWIRYTGTGAALRSGVLRLSTPWKSPASPDGSGIIPILTAFRVRRGSALRASLRAPRTSQDSRFSFGSAHQRRQLCWDRARREPWRADRARG